MSSFHSLESSSFGHKNIYPLNDTQVEDTGYDYYLVKSAFY